MPTMMGGWGMTWFSFVGMSLLVGIGVARIRHGSDKQTTTPLPTDPVRLARERYAKGEISHQEFERTVEGLLRTER